MNNTHLETLKAELKALEEKAKQITAELGSLHVKEHFNKKNIKLKLQEIAASEELEPKEQ